jgi:F-type H+-transporting ATPase subunit delta
MIISRVAGRYANALFTEAEQTKTLETILDDLRSLRSMLQESRELALFVANPAIKAAHKRTALAAIADKAGLSAMTKNWLGLLVEKSRVGELYDIIAAFEELYNKAHNIMPVVITSALELDSSQKSNLLAKLEAQTGKKILPTFATNPALIGGFTVKIGDTLIDSSISRQLATLKKRMMENAMN